MKTIKDEDKNEDSTRLPSPHENMFARFAFTVSREKSRSSSKVKSSIPNRMSHKRKQNLDKSSDDEEKRNAKTKRAAIDKGLELPSTISRSSSSNVKLYEHLPPLQDNLNVGLDIIFCGINPGQRSAEIGHHYGNPNNHFWGCLYESGLTTRKLDPRDDVILPQDFSIGLTNLVARPTAQQNELSKDEQVAGVPILLGKVARFKPRVLCFVGLGIADVFRSSIVADNQARGAAGSNLKLKLKKSSTIGLQPYKMIHRSNSQGSSETLFFAVSSTSGRVVRYQKADKVKQFQDLRQLVRDIKDGIFDTSTMSQIASPSIQELESHR